GSRTLVDVLVNRARSFMFSTAPVPAATAAATAAIRIVQSPEGEVLRQRLWQLVDEVKNSVIHSGWTLPPIQSAILPLRLGEEGKAVSAAQSLRDRGIFVPAIRYPTVPRGQARLRLTLTASHQLEDIAKLASALNELKSQL